MYNAAAIASGITVNELGGNELFGVDNAGSYDVLGVMQVRNVLYTCYKACHMECNDAHV
jgi:hypothetical protein